MGRPRRAFSKVGPRRRKRRRSREISDGQPTEHHWIAKPHGARRSHCHHSGCARPQVETRDDDRHRPPRVAGPRSPENPRLLRAGSRRLLHQRHSAHVALPPHYPREYATVGRGRVGRRGRERSRIGANAVSLESTSRNPNHRDQSGSPRRGAVLQPAADPIDVEGSELQARRTREAVEDLRLDQRRRNTTLRLFAGISATIGTENPTDCAIAATASRSRRPQAGLRSRRLWSNAWLLGAVAKPSRLYGP